MHAVDVIIIGAGAAGLMCAIESGKRKRRVLVLESANKPGKKILMSGGGRCNFTNFHIHPDKYISHNRHFCKSALSRYTQWDFIDLVKHHHISFHEKTLGQLFCDEKSPAILALLLKECQLANVDIRLMSKISNVTKLADQHFKVTVNGQDIHCQSLVIASGGLSIPTLGSSPFGYHLAKQFAINVWPTRAGLVPLTMTMADKEKYGQLTGVAVTSLVSHPKITFKENILFTHRGLSGPAILQISSYWQQGESLSINLLPELDIYSLLEKAKQSQPQKQINTILADYLPKRVVDTFLANFQEMKLATISQQLMTEITKTFSAWQFTPEGSEGYRTAEVTLGGVDCDAISSKTMMATKIPGLFFIGEVLDVSGWLGGYNFQWAWSSGWAAGQVV